jgi:hypothetical protein
LSISYLISNNLLIRRDNRRKITLSISYLNIKVYCICLARCPGFCCISVTGNTRSDM